MVETEGRLGNGQGGEGAYFGNDIGTGNAVQDGHVTGNGTGNGNVTEGMTWNPEQANGQGTW
jgi:hypothetical protein